MAASEILTASLALALAGAAPQVPAAAPETPAAVCRSVPAAPAITVNVEYDNPDFNISDDFAALGHAVALTAESAARPLNGRVAGVMEGGVAFDHALTMGHGYDRDSGVSCAWIEKIDVTIRAGHRVHIAREAQADECLFGVVFGHEARHVEIDRDLMEKYRARVVDGLQMALSFPEDYFTGPVALSDLRGPRNALSQGIEGALAVLHQSLQREREAAQAAIDTPEEYAALGAACPLDAPADESDLTSAAMPGEPEVIAKQ